MEILWGYGLKAMATCFLFFSFLANLMGVLLGLARHFFSTKKSSQIECESVNFFSRKEYTHFVCSALELHYYSTICKAVGQEGTRSKIKLNPFGSWNTLERSHMPTDE